MLTGGGNLAWADTDVTSSVSTSGWKLTNGTTTAGTTAANASPFVTPSGGSSVAMYENYETTTATTGILLQQTISGLTNGTYRVELYANAMYTSGRGFDGNASLARVYVFANDQYKEITTEEKASTTANGEYTINNVAITDGTLKLGLYKNSAGTNWHNIQIKSLTLLSDPLATNREALKSASSSSPIDATDFIKGSVITNSNATPWTFTGSGRNYSASVWEVYNQNFKLSQTISNLPKGRYILKVQGFYRAGGGGATSTAQNVKLFGNSTTANVLNILNDSYDSKPETGGWSEVSSKFVPNDRTAGGYAFYTGKKYKNNSLTVTLTDNTLELGLEKTTAVGSDWSLFNNFELQCLGVYISGLSETFTSGSTMEADQWYSFTVPTDGDYTFSATDGIVYSITDEFASSSFNNVSSTTALRAGTVYLKSTTSQALTISYVTPVVANGDYYLYDATNKLFLSRGNKYGTEASLDKYGVPFTYNNYEKSIRFKDWSDVGMFYSSGETAYFTDGTPGQFTFETTTGGLFLYDKANSKYIKYSASAQTAFSANSLAQAASSAEATIWTIKTKAERDAIVATYATENMSDVITSASLTSETDAEGFETWLTANRAAKDRTSSVGTPKFTDGNGNWEYTQVENRSGATNYGTDYAEMFQRTGYWSQTISSLPQGIYKVTVNAFERNRDYTTCNTLGSEGYEIVTSYFEANNEKVQLASWYSDKTGTNNPDDTGQAATAFNNDKYKIEVYTYVGSDGNLTLKIVKPAFQWSSWVLFNNVTLTYYDTAVSDEERTAILAEASTIMGSPMKASLYQALATAKSNFEGSNTVPYYNALRTAIDNCATSITSYANMYTNYLQPINTNLATTNFIDRSSSAYTTYATYKDAYDNYTNAETADVENATANALSITSGGGTNYTSTYSQLLLPNWTIDGNAAITNNSGFYINSWSTENKGTGDAADFANPFFEKWVSSGSIPACTLEGTLTGLTANTAYQVTANVRVQGSTKVAGSITMEVVGGAPVDVTAGDAIMDGETETGRYIKSYTATGVTDGSGNLVLKFNVAANSNVSWLAFRDVNYTTSDATVSNDFTALNSAISTTENSIGFEDGEYAPYENTAKMNALATAKALDQTRYYIPSVITAATSALTSVDWTKQNSGEVNAIYDGSFAATYSHEGYVKPTGWTGGTGHDNATDVRYMWDESSNAGLAATTNSTALFTKFDAYYGRTEGYTMPLKGNTVYKLTFKYGTWGTGDDQTRGDAYVQMEDGSGNTITVYPSSLALTTDQRGANASTEKWYNFTGYFTTAEAGNYVLDLLKTTTSQQNQYVYGDIELKKAVAEDVAINETEAYEQAYKYANVTLTRTFTENVWNTFVVPFDIDNATLKAEFGNDVKVAEATLSATSVSFNTMDTPAITANKPVIIKGVSKSGPYTFNGVFLENETPTITDNGTSFVGNYGGRISIPDKAYYIASNQLKISNGTQYIKGLRAYFTTTSEARLSFFLDNEETTAIEGIDNDTIQTTGSVYNLKGMKMSENGKLQKGVYVRNGKKFIVK